MILQPLFRNFSEKAYQLILLSMVVIIYILVCAEADIYVPAFPQMIKYFDVAENEIQLILSINFIGLFFSGLIAGPLSDSFGRRKVILAGLALLMVSSIILVMLDNFKLLLFWRFIQGIAA
ncbi:MAG: MFS transporter, partial [Rickettsiales bacterium]